MGRLIDAEYLLDLIKDINGERYGYIDAEDINNAPTVDAVPVVHGHWRRGKSYPHNIYCSNCFRTYVPNEEIELWKDQTLPRKYCPECGALMDEVTES